MSDYNQINDYSAKDALTTGDPEKLILGSDIDDELAAISTAIATKYDSADLASQAQAQAETSNVVLMTPLRTADWSDANAGMVGDLQALADPNADRITFWDDSAGALALLSLGTGLAISGTTLAVSTTLGVLEDIAGFTDANADRIFGWDDSADAAIQFSLSTGLTTSGTNLLIDTAVVPQLTAASNTFSNAGGPFIALRSTAAGAQTYLRFDINSVTKGYVGVAGTAADLVTGSSANALVIRNESAGIHFSADAGSSIALTIDSSNNFDFKDGTVTTTNASASEVGYKGLPLNEQSVDYTCVLADANKAVGQTGASKTITIPANASVAYPLGTTLTFYGRVGGTTTIAINSDTMYLRGTGFATTGSRTLAAGGIATAIKITSTTWWIGGDVT